MQAPSIGVKTTLPKKRYRYHAYGKTLVSDIPLTGLLKSEGAFESSHTALITISRVELKKAERTIPFAYSLRKNTHAIAAYNPLPPQIRLTQNNSVQISFNNSAHFTIHNSGLSIQYQWPDFAETTGMGYLLGPILSYAIRLQGQCCLHASAVNMYGNAVAFIGKSGSGKSTLAAKLAQAGHAFISDDLLVLNQVGTRLQVEPGVQNFRLWPKSAKRLAKDYKHFPKVVTGLGKRRIAIQELQKPLPVEVHGRRLKALFFLQKQPSKPTLSSISPISSPAALIQLTALTHPSPHYPITSQQRQADFHILSKLLETTPSFTLPSRSGFDKLDEMVNAIESTVHTLT